MYTVFHVKNFRCFDDLMLDDLARVNLLAGKNNVGKTALLEALFVHAGGYNPELALRLNAFRGIPTIRFQITQWSEVPWHPLFPGFDTSLEITFEGQNEEGEQRSLLIKEIKDVEELRKLHQNIQPATNGKENSVSSAVEPIRVLRLEYRDKERTLTTHAVIDREGVHTELVPPSPFEVVFLAGRSRSPFQEEATRFTNLRLKGKKDFLLDALRILETRLTDIELLSFGGETMLHGDVGTSRPVPLVYMGDGIMRLASLISAIGNAPNGVVLVDEIENGLHHSILKDVWKAIAKAARAFNTQVFATTHSWECIVAAHQAFSEDEQYDFRLHRLEQKKEGGIRVVSLDKETLGASIELGYEVR